MTRVPFMDLSRSVSTIRDGVLRDWEECLDGSEFVGGARVTRLAAALRGQLGASHVVPCANGTDALILGLQASGARSGMRIAVPNVTFWATYEAVIHAGCEPVLIDIDPDDLQMSFDEFKRAHDELRFDGAILAHLFGWCSNRLGDFRAFSKSRGLILVEDGAQAYGVELNGRSLFAEASCGTLSFYPAKVLGGAMDGGAMTFSEAGAAEKAQRLCNHGRQGGHYAYTDVGWNSRMGGLQAAFLLRMLAASEDLLGSRRAAYARYQRAFASLNLETARWRMPPAGVIGNGYLAVLTCEGRREATGAKVVEALAGLGIGCAQIYPASLDEQPPAAGALRVSDLVNSKRFCRSVVNLPLFAAITADEVDAAVTAFAKVIEE